MIGTRHHLADAVDQVEQLAGRAAELVELGHHNDVAGLQLGHELGELRPVGPDAADLLAVDRGRSSRGFSRASDLNLFALSGTFHFAAFRNDPAAVFSNPIAVAPTFFVTPATRGAFYN